MKAILPLLIFIFRALDVSVGSIRTIFLIRGKSFLASLFAFIEIIIWFLVVNKIMTRSLNIINLLFYAGGYSFGTFLGILINKKFVKKNINAVLITENINDYTKYIDNKKAKVFKNKSSYIVFIKADKKSLKAIKNVNKNAFILTCESIFD